MNFEFRPKLAFATTHDVHSIQWKEIVDFRLWRNDERNSGIFFFYFDSFRLFRYLHRVFASSCEQMLSIRGRYIEMNENNKNKWHLVEVWREIGGGNRRCLRLILLKHERDNDYDRWQRKYAKKDVTTYERTKGIQYDRHLPHRCANAKH